MWFFHSHKFVRLTLNEPLHTPIPYHLIVHTFNSVYYLRMELCVDIKKLRVYKVISRRIIKHLKMILENLLWWCLLGFISHLSLFFAVLHNNTVLNWRKAKKKKNKGKKCWSFYFKRVDSFDCFSSGRTLSVWLAFWLFFGNFMRCCWLFLFEIFEDF